MLHTRSQSVMPVVNGYSRTWETSRYSQTLAIRSPTGTMSDGIRLATRAPGRSTERQWAATLTAFQMMSCFRRGVGVGSPVVPVVA
ncbi:hypothetical protein D3C80_1463550 [compost metagenome]